MKATKRRSTKRHDIGGENAAFAVGAFFGMGLLLLLAACAETLERESNGT